MVLTDLAILDPMNLGQREWLFNVKRYTSGSVGESEIRDFKGTMDSFNAEYGIFVTTSSYTDTAKAIAVRGNRTVTLIDGQELCDLVEKYQLHITPVTTYTLNDYYFEKD